MTGVERIAAERQRQIDAEGWTPEHDDGHRHAELAVEAALLAANETDLQFPNGDDVETSCWGLLTKHANNRVRQLEIAGALIAAEIDRIQRRDAANE